MGIQLSNEGLGESDIVKIGICFLVCVMEWGKILCGL